MKIVKVVIVVIAVVAIAWSYGWYQGRYAPSQIDSAQLEQGSAVAYLAGGCFWCTEHDFEKVYGVTNVTSGYMGGAMERPSYEEVTKGDSGHREMVKVEYDPFKVSYKRLVLELLRETDPTDDGGSFFDRGYQYTSAVYVQNAEEEQVAKEVFAEVIARGVFEKPIVTSIEPASTFWVAEGYHQDFATHNQLRYQYYRNGSGRDAYIESIWGDGAYADIFEDSISSAERHWEGYTKPDDTALRAVLTEQQYSVTQHESTESPFHNKYWDNYQEGVYVDIVSGEPLFSSTDKFDSGTGWPSFLKPIASGVVTEREDFKLILPRTEVRSRYADSHLGHILLDGPESNNYVRYCINSAALRFIPLVELEKEGLGMHVSLFPQRT